MSSRYFTHRAAYKLCREDETFLQLERAVFDALYPSFDFINHRYFPREPEGKEQIDERLCVLRDRIIDLGYEEYADYISLEVQIPF
jgi:hypothetical protein